VTTYTLLRGAALKQWVKQYVTDRGNNISADSADLMSVLVGGNLWAMSNELDKLMAYCSGRTISEEDVRNTVSYAQEFNVFNMIDAILEFKPGVAEKSLQQLLEKGTPPVQLLVMLSRQVQRLVQVKDMKSRGTSENEIRSKLGISLPFL
jgi:DNA polymerase-3 subunit delta